MDLLTYLLLASAPASAEGAWTWDAAVAALTLGVAGSLHCFVMCGPLACASLSSSRGSRGRAIVSYQGARVASYSLTGAVLGGCGSELLGGLSFPSGRVLPWLMVAALIATALDLGKRMKPLPGVSHLLRRLAPLGARFTAVGRGALMGALTPLLPCGLLYGLYASALAAGSAARGALLMGLFALGAIPALVAAQVQARWLSRLTAESDWVLRRGLPLLAAGVLAWRALNAGHCAHCH